MSIDVTLGTADASSQAAAGFGNTRVFNTGVAPSPPSAFDFLLLQSFLLTPDAALAGAAAFDFSAETGPADIAFDTAAADSHAVAPTFWFTPTEDVPTEQVGGRRLFNESDRFLVTGWRWQEAERRLTLTLARIRPPGPFGTMRDT